MRNKRSKYIKIYFAMIIQKKQHSLNFLFLKLHQDFFFSSFLFVHYITFLVISSINYLLVNLIQWQEILASSDRAFLRRSPIFNL